jgi:hypothetical protein
MNASEYRDLAWLAQATYIRFDNTPNFYASPARLANELGNPMEQDQSAPRDLTPKQANLLAGNLGPREGIGVRYRLKSQHKFQAIFVV